MATAGFVSNGKPNISRKVASSRNSLLAEKDEKANVPGSIIQRRARHLGGPYIGDVPNVYPGPP